MVWWDHGMCLIARAQVTSGRVVGLLLLHEYHTQWQLLLAAALLWILTEWEEQLQQLSLDPAHPAAGAPTKEQAGTQPQPLLLIHDHNTWITREGHKGC